MSEARSKGYEISLVFVTTEHPDVNVSRVQDRVAKGGHPVDAQKIRDRYQAAMKLLPSALEQADQAWVIDNSLPYSLGKPPVTVAAKFGLTKEPEFPESGVAWANDLQRKMQERRVSLAHLGTVLKSKNPNPYVEWATAKHGTRYQGEIIAATPIHALQKLDGKNARGQDQHVIHDLALTQQKQLVQGQHLVVSYAFKHGKIEEIEPPSKKLNDLDRG